MARKYRRPPTARDKRFKRSPQADSGPAERWQHSARAVELTDNAGIFVARAMHEHVLDRMLALGFIDAAGRAAGLRLHEDYHLARIEEKISASLSPVRGAGGDPQGRLERNAAQEAGYKRWRKALAALPVAARDVVIHAACVGCWPQVMHLPRLKEGLTRLARYYGVS